LRNYIHIAKIKGIKSPFFVMIVLFLIFSFGLPQAEGDIVEKISIELNSGDVEALGKYFNSTIELILPDSEGTYSNKQTEQLLKAFFKSNPVKSFTLDHHGNSNDGSRYLIGTLVNNSGIAFRVYVLIKKDAGSNLVQQLQIEEK